MRLLALFLLSPALVFSQETSTTLEKNADDLKTEKVKEKTDKADELITNRRFRASNGSLTKLSMNTSISYSGGSLSDPFSASRPNISNAGDTALISGLSGSIGASYRVSKLHRINAGFGIQMLAPFNSSSGSSDPAINAEFDKNARELDASNPSVSHTYVNKFYGVQTVITSGLTFFTAGNFTNAGYRNSLDFSVNTMYEFKGTGFSIGALFLGTRNFFDNDRQELLARQNETIMGFLPQAEYVINDTFNLRTIVRSHWYQNNRLARSSNFKRRPVTQSVGLGISVTRDVFLYPNVQFAYDEFTFDNTNVGLTANINLF